MRLVSVDASLGPLNLTCRQDRNMRYLHYVDLGRSWLSVGERRLPGQDRISQIGKITRNTYGSQFPRALFASTRLRAR